MAEVVVALDLASGREAMGLVERIPGLRWVKVGSVLMTREGPGLVRGLRARGLEIFLDLKWHDIPNTVAGAVAVARDLDVRMATVHTLGGRQMMEAAARAAGAHLGLVGVTVLTSHDDRAYEMTMGRTGVNLKEEVTRHSRNAMEAGLRGVVCSPLEIGAVRAVVNEPGWIVVPGVRRVDDAAGDQMRIAGPRAATAAGATHLVVGRPIYQASDPAGAFRAFVEAAR
ncbi:MAG: orotidine-5'-phosphate decarboxylase [Gemmatimonadales bacterium]